MSDRLLWIEQKIGGAIPEDYAEFLKSHKSVQEPNCYLSFNPERWVIRSLFELGSGAPHRQLDQMYRLVGDVLPAGTLPIASDWAGNLYLLRCVGSSRGEVVWWDHERDVGDNSVCHVAKSFAEFRESLVYEES